MIIKNIALGSKISFSRGTYYWLMFMIDHYQSVRKMLNIDFESFIILETVITHFLHNINKEENADWLKMWELTNDEKAKNNLSKSKLTSSSISLVTSLPRETVRRKILELNKKKILVYDKKKGILLGEKFEIFHKKFTQRTTLKMSEMLKKWNKIGTLAFILDVNKQQIPATFKTFDKTLKF
jgi:hypothetical protein|tara:strand:+ start:641 stop:1186 length:546 start_codon:yes stop_codon:yes gene_type:complete